MKHIIGALLILLTFSACSPADEPVSGWLDHGGVLIDTRTIEEFRAGHINGSELIPYEQMGQRIASVAPSKDTPILLYCRSGRRAGIAEKELIKMGYTKVKNLGGMSEAKTAIGL